MPKPRLWTPLANALEAYRRRVVIEPAAEYEHIWRLIHIQEALAVCLMSLMATRLAHVLVERADEDELKALREGLTGLRPDARGPDDDDEVEQSPWGGSVGAWIELLRRHGKSAAKAGDPFLSALATYLSASPNRPLAFADAWARIAPVPATFREASMDRVGRLGAINSFRNKLAHVPVPQRLLGELHRGLRVEVLDGLTDKFDPNADASSFGFSATSYREPLTGILYVGNTFVTGGNEVGIDTGRPVLSSVVHASYKDASGAVEWPVEPFFRVDGEAKTALLFRVTDLGREPGAAGYGGEYHRFAAELEPVTYVTISSEVIAPWIPKPSPLASSDPRIETPTVPSGAALSITPPAGDATAPAVTDEDVAEPSPRQLRESAEGAFSRRDYSGAVRLFDALATAGDPREYNDVARSKHGAALWRAAEHRTVAPDDLQAPLLNAVALLQQAERHRDPRYSARSAYERSKALWHLWRATGEVTRLSEALAAAERAVSKSPEEAFISWQARVKSDASVAIPQGIEASTTEGA